ncbi:MAG: cell division protein FtsA [Candidatus Sungbacteria bacterium]|nr:cell division protein FtsA [Candidatus Sungbacteria bacterium]
MRGVSAGIDIGTGTVTTVVLSRNKGDLPSILGAGQARSDGVRKGTVVDHEALAAAIKKSALAAAKEANVSIKEAAVTFSGASIRSSLSRGVVAVSRADGEITQDDVRRSLQAAESLHLKNANREIVHLSPRAFWVDGEGDIKDPVGMVGMRLETEALIIEGDKRALQNLGKSLDGAGISIWDWIFSPLVCSRVVLTKEQRELGVMLLDIGAGNSSYGIWREGSLLDAGVIPVGGDLATHDIAVMLKTKVEVAEAIKRKYGHVSPESFSRGDVIKLAEFVENDTETYSRKELGEVIKARMADVFELAAEPLHKGGRSLLLPAGVVLIGRAAMLPGIREFAKRELRLPVERAKISGVDLGKFAELVSAPAVAVSLWFLQESGGISESGISRPFAKTWPLFKNFLKVFLP